MTLRKISKIIFALLVLLAIAIALTSIKHPIILKWVTGGARHFGTAMPATVYVNGRANDYIKVFYSDEPDNYLISLADYNPLVRLKFLNINLEGKWMGRQVGMNRDDYDFIAGHLFLSDTGEHFSPFQDVRTGLNFDPKFSVSGRQIKFNMPPNDLKMDSLRIKLP